MKRFYSSDWHMSHKNVTGPKISNWDKGYRIFDTTEEMDETIIKGVNNTIGQDDHLYYLGDFTLGDKVQKYRDRIICKNITYILGNHDDRRSIEKVFGVMNTFDVKMITIEDKQKIFMSHYAHRVWEGSHKNTIHLYGHSHDSLDCHGEEWGKSMDVSVDSAYRILGEWRPFSEDEILRIMSKRDVKQVDHHNLRS